MNKTRGQTTRGLKDPGRKAQKLDSGTAKTPADVQASAGEPYLLDICDLADSRIKLICEMLVADSATRVMHPDEIAKILNISTSRLRHLFKQETGMPFARFVKLVRLGDARTLFLNSRLSVKEVMVKVGLNDVSHFVRDFKMAYGERPSRMRMTFFERALVADSANK